VADGETVEDALRATYDVARFWTETAREFDDPIPEPDTGGISGTFVARVPKSLHARPAALARREGSA